MTSEERLRIRADSGPTLVWEAGPDKLCNYFNKVWLEFTGRTLEQELGDGWAQGVHPDDLEGCWSAYVAAFDRREDFTIDYRLRRADGVYRWLQDAGRPLFAAGGEFLGYIGHCVDIDDRRRAESELRSSEAKYRQFVELGSEGMALVDEDGRLIEWNRALEALSGLGRAEVLGLSFLEVQNRLAPPQLRMPELLEMQHALVQQALRTGQSPILDRLIEASYLHRDGSVHYVQQLVFPIPRPTGWRLGVLTRDITPLRRASEAQRQAKERLERILDGTRAGTWEWNVQTGETLFNERWAEMVGWTLAELAPVSIATWERLAHPDDLQRSYEALERHFRGEAPYYDLECRIRHRDGHWVWVRDRGKVLTWTNDGKPLMMFGTHLDVSDQHRDAERIERLLVEKDALLREVHHRIKNNMNNLVAFMTLQAHGLHDQGAIRALEDATGRVQSMMRLYERLYQSSNYNAVEMDQFFDELVDEILAGFANREQVTVVKRLAKVTLNADQAQALAIVLCELLTNAMKYAFGGGTGSLAVHLDLEGDRCRLVVHDDGRGLSADSEAGVGFGLLLLRLLSQQLGGALTFTADRGTRAELAFVVATPNVLS